MMKIPKVPTKLVIWTFVLIFVEWIFFSYRWLAFGGERNQTFFFVYSFVLMFSGFSLWWTLTEEANKQ